MSDPVDTNLIAGNAKDVPIAILCRDRVTPLRQLLDWLDAAGYTQTILVDNASTFPPLVEFLTGQSEREVMHLADNLGHLAPWTSAEVRDRLKTGPYVVTDCDIVPDESCPYDVVEHLAGVLSAQPDASKAGLGLRIDDLPDSYALKKAVIEWESPFWELEISPQVFYAPIDTTFALYRPGVEEGHGLFRALRTGPPYVARHLSWYADSSSPTAEERYYREHADPSLVHWEAQTLSEPLRDGLRLRSERRDPVRAAQRRVRTQASRPDGSDSKSTG